MECYLQCAYYYHCYYYDYYNGHCWKIRIYKQKAKAFMLQHLSKTSWICVSLSVTHSHLSFPVLQSGFGPKMLCHNHNVLHVAKSCVLISFLPLSYSTSQGCCTVDCIPHLDTPSSVGAWEAPPSCFPSNLTLQATQPVFSTTSKERCPLPSSLI